MRHITRRVPSSNALGNSDEAALIIAAKYGLCSEDGTLDGTQRKSVTLSDGTQTSVEVIGFRHDAKTYDVGEAGITWAFCDIVKNHVYNPSNTIEGGWAQSSLRTYTNGELFESLPEDLQSQADWVDKSTNNVGVVTEETAEDAVSATSDRLWLLSAREVYGSIYWWTRGGWGEFYDDVYNAEGQQYQLFRDAGINDGTDTSNLLRKGGIWWLRSPNPFEDEKCWGSACYVDASGYKDADQQATELNGVVPCFCI